MVRNITLLVVALTLGLNSCTNKARLLKDTMAAAEIAEKIGAQQYKFYYTTEEVPPTNEKTHYVTLDISGLANPEFDKEQVASYCAVDLYKGLSSETISQNQGINIIFNHDFDPLKPMPYFFTFQELSEAVKIFDNIDKYVTCTLQPLCAETFLYFDTSEFHITPAQLDTLQSQLKANTQNAILSTTRLYLRKPVKYTDENSDSAMINVLYIFDLPRSKVYMPFYAPLNRFAKIQNAKPAYTEITTVSVTPP